MLLFHVEVMHWSCEYELWMQFVVVNAAVVNEMQLCTWFQDVKALSVNSLPVWNLVYSCECCSCECIAVVNAAVVNEMQLWIWFGDIKVRVVNC